MVIRYGLQKLCWSSLIVPGNSFPFMSFEELFHLREHSEMTCMLGGYRIGSVNGWHRGASWDVAFVLGVQDQRIWPDSILSCYKVWEYP